MAENVSVTIALFGAFQITVNGEAVTRFRSNKARALLIYLVLTHPRPVLRTTLSELLWPDYTSPSAQANLRQTLANLRDLFTPFDLIDADRQYVRLCVEPASVWCDVIEFHALLDACQRHAHADLGYCSVCQPRLQRAVALAEGGLLENFLEKDSAPFNAWLADERAHFAARLAAAQATLAAERAPLGNLPPPLTPLLGRTSELADLTAKLQHPIYRCVSLVGPGGIGKTRLACAVGDQLRQHFPAGVWLVELGALAPTTAEEPLEQLQDRIATALATALGFTLRGATPPAAQVTHYLADKAMLLILDRFEHLMPGAAWLPALLTAAPRLRLLITARQRLPLQSQLVYQLQGLAAPR
ncbi:MAG: NB-ARC domain-containing protein [Caldilineaceae bacterium]